MKTNHTPGPWALSKVGNNYDQWMIYAENDPRGATIATIEGKGNAQIIAAAPLLPDMAAALRDCLGDWPEFDDDQPVSGADLVEWFGSYRNRVRRILAKWEAMQ